MRSRVLALQCILINSSLRAPRVKLATWQSLQTPVQFTTNEPIACARRAFRNSLWERNEWPRGRFVTLRARAQLICVVHCLPQRVSLLFNSERAFVLSKAPFTNVTKGFSCHRLRFHSASRHNCWKYSIKAIRHRHIDDRYADKAPAQKKLPAVETLVIFICNRETDTLCLAYDEPYDHISARSSY